MVGPLPAHVPSGPDAQLPVNQLHQTGFRIPISVALAGEQAGDFARR
jgi:hypothetical protein